MTAEIIFQTPDGESIGGKTNQGAGLGEGEGRGCFWHPRVSTGVPKTGNAESEHLFSGRSPTLTRMRAPARNLHRINEG
jgi:hypothetical protein